MAITRANAETILIRRAGKKMALVGMDSTTINGTNADFEDPLAVALRKMGLEAYAPVTDAQISPLGSDEVDEFLDRAELRLLENIAGNIDLVDVSIGPRRESLGQLAGQVADLIKERREYIKAEYGSGIGTLTAGTVRLDFAQKHDDERV